MPSNEPKPLAQDDILVTGIRDLNEADSVVTQRTFNSSRLGPSVRDNAQTFASATRLFHCAIRPRMGQIALLRAAVDGTMNSVRQDNAQRQLVRINAACATDADYARTEGLAAMTVSGGPPNREYGFYFDRGAMFVRVLQLYASHFRMTRTDTEKPEVLMRLAMREAPRARLRLPQDRRYFDAAICFVRFQPELSLRLVLTDQSVAAYENLEAQIVNGARKQCVGSAKRVYFDPIQFRFYIADAAYRWAVAVSGVETLIQDDNAVKRPDARVP